MALGYGSCYASDRIAVDGCPVGYCYREEPDNDTDTDSGWRFFAGELLHSFCATVVIGLTLLAEPAHAQVPPGYIDRPPAQLASDAFASAYGRLLVGEFGKMLAESADRGCLRDKGIAVDSLERRGSEILVRNATKYLEISFELVDKTRFESALVAHTGSNALAEIDQLKTDPLVKKYNDLIEPAKLAAVVDVVTENVGRHALLEGIQLSKGPSPLMTGDLRLLRANPRGESLENADRFLQDNPTPELKRWDELTQALVLAFEEAVDRDAILKLGPIQFTPNLPADLAAVCVTPQER